uniref:Uncharacterized protein LOC113789734 n=1 Tax=Dermatophagoides pteronyssinus TaxID=6956 RepID=A0A6P6XQP0_DERPT|nr:uncharacterized protein LOC113789734 [Dermatophagoides pteronyssinus]
MVKISTASIMVTIFSMFIGWSLAVGRNPTPVEHNACRVKWSEHVNEVKRTYKDDRARVVAVNRGLDGSPCMTSCRIIFRGNQKDMEDIYTPDDVQCATGTNPRFCQKGRCVLPAKYRNGQNGESIDEV